MSTILEQLNRYLTTASKATLDADFEELKHFNEVGPTVDDYFMALKKRYVVPFYVLEPSSYKIDSSEFLTSDCHLSSDNNYKAA